MSRRYFGTDGIRGTVGQAPITPDFMLRLGHAVGRVLRSKSAPTVLIGKDTRISGYMIESRSRPASRRRASTSCCSARCRRRASPTSRGRCAWTSAW